MTSSDGSITYSYDADGNLIQKTTIAKGATVTYAWDYCNRLTDVTDKDASGTVTGHVHYTYDPFDRRLSESIDSTGGGTYDHVEHYVYDGNNLLMVLDESRT